MVFLFRKRNRDVLRAAVFDRVVECFLCDAIEMIRQMGIVDEHWTSKLETAFRCGFGIPPVDEVRQMAHQVFGLTDAFLLGTKPGVVMWVFMGLI